MTKKISSVELEKIIAEEIEKTLVDEGFGDFAKRVAGAGKAAVSGALEKGKEKWKEIGQQQTDVKQSQEMLSKIATFIEYTRGMPDIQRLIKSTKIGQHLFGGSQAQMMEQYESQISKMLKTLNPAELKTAVDEFMQAISSDTQAVTIMKKLTGQDERYRKYRWSTQSKTQPEQPAPAASAAQAEPAQAQAEPAQAQAEPAQAEPAQAQAEPAQAEPAQAQAEPTQAQAEPTQAQAEPTQASDVQSPEPTEGNPEDIVSDKVNPHITKKVNEDNINKARLQYKALNKEKKIGFADGQVDVLVNTLAKNGLIYLRDTEVELPIQEEEKPAPQIKEFIFQRMGIKTISALRKDEKFIKMIDALHKITNFDRQKIINFLIEIWKEGKLIKPISKIEAQQEYEKDREAMMGQQAVAKEIEQAVAKEIEQGLQEQKDRWQKLAGILKD